MENQLISPRDWDLMKPKVWDFYSGYSKIEWARVNRMLTKIEAALPVWERYEFLSHRRANPKRRAMWQDLSQEYRDYVNLLYHRINEMVFWAAIKCPA